MGFTNTKVPIHQAEFDTNFASPGPSTLNYKVLAIGQKIIAGTATLNTRLLIGSPSDALKLFGEGSMLHIQALKFFENNVANEFHSIAISDDDVGSPSNHATGTITVTGTATADGNVAIYIQGKRINVVITSGDVANTVATAINTAIVAAANLPIPVKSAVATNVVTLTALNVGEQGNDIDIRINDAESEELPAGISSVAIVGMASGASNPSIATAIAALGSEWYQIFLFPYHDTTNYDAMKVFLDDRDGATQKIDGVAYSTKKDTFANLVTFGVGKNSKQFVSVGNTNSMSSPVEFDAAIAGQVAGHLSNGNGNEAKPFTTLVLKGIFPDKEATRFTFTEETSLLNNGVALSRANSSGETAILRLITTFQKDTGGAPSLAWLDSTTRFTAMFIRFDWVRVISAKYGQAKLADSLDGIGPNQIVMTPAVGRGEAITAFKAWQFLGLVEDFDNFKDSLTATRDLGDQNKFLWHLFPDFINQLRNIETTISFVL